MRIENKFMPMKLQLFAGRNYMMRSEKRSGMHTAGSAAPSGNRPKRRRKRAGFFYKLATMLLLILLWPIGLLLLWQRKLRWNMSTKLMVSLVTLLACIVLYGFALTVNTTNARYTAIQDSVVEALDDASAWLGKAGDTIGDQAGKLYVNAADFGEALWSTYRGDIADAIDAGVDLAGSLNSRWFGSGDATVDDATEASTAEMTASPAEEATIAPTYGLTAALTDAPTGKATDAPTKAATDAPTDKPTDNPTEKPTDKPTEKPTEAPTDKPTEAPTDKPADEPTDAPAVAATPKAAKQTHVIGEGLVIKTAAAAPAATAAPTEAPAEAATEEPTAEPTEESTAEPAAASTEEPAPAAASRVYDPTEGTLPAGGKAIASGTLMRDGTLDAKSVDVTLKAAKDAAVYYNNGGKYYHLNPTCKDMKKAAPEHTFGEAIASGKKQCPNCACPDPALLNEPCIVWVDENNVAHTGDDCESFEGNYTLMRAADVDDNIGVCESCGAAEYLVAVKNGDVITLNGEAAAQTEAEPETAAEETDAEPEPAVVPESATQVYPTVKLKAAGDALVYHSRTGHWYHTNGTCSGMSYASQYKLSECVSDYKRCKKCNAPLPEYVGQHCLWQDETGICHTSDECTEFSGKYTLIPRDEALEKGLAGCTVCGGYEYLISDTEIVYPKDDTVDPLDGLAVAG